MRSTPEDLATGTWEFYDPAVAFPTIHADDTPSLQIGLSAPGGGTFGEFRIEFVELGGKICARLDAFTDSFQAIGTTDLIARLSELDGKREDMPEVRDLLLSMGMTDVTEQLADRSVLAVCSECNGRGHVRKIALEQGDR